MKMDTITGFALKAVDILLLKNPVRTSIGILIGIVLWGFSKALIPGLIVPWIAWIALGVVLVNLKRSPVKTKLPEDVELILDLIDKADQAGISELEKKQMYRRLLKKYIDNVVLSQEFQKKLGELQAPIEEE